tara:strand:+ start:34 stop:261 length:228 start_codon:yes stop_codon:yes gene_type:complete
LTNGINWENKKLILRQELISGGVIATEEFAIGYGKVLEASVVFFDNWIHHLFYSKIDELHQEESRRPKKQYHNYT